MFLRIAHLYPETLSLYGDRGNILAVQKRCLWRGIQVFLAELEIGERGDLTSFDFLFLGGGQDSDQALAARDLLIRKGELERALGDGIVLFAVCGGYQLLGHSYQAEDQEIDGLQIFHMHTVAGDKRFIGNVEVAVTCFEDSFPLVGFENHSGRTYLREGMNPLGRVEVGFGNNGEDGGEGCRCGNFFGTYLHGPLLPKNPLFTDHLLSLALQRRYPGVELSPLNDSLEEKAHGRAREVTRSKRR